MVGIAAALQYLFPTGIPLVDWVVVDNGNGEQIAVWNRQEPQPTEIEIISALLPAAKVAGIAANRAECERRIFARYPAGRQLSALSGMYDSANVQTMHDWISSMIAAENAAADAIEAAITVATVEAVTVAWPA